MPSRARRALPQGATDVHESYGGARFGHDYVRCLKARVTHEGFLEFARRLDLTKEYTQEKHRALELGWPLCDEPWWDPSPSLDGALVQHGRTDYAVAKYENGYVYFAAFCW